VVEIKRRSIHTLRVHVSGDFFSPAYTAKWLAIARQCRRTIFYAYTRSWRVAQVAPLLGELAQLGNIRLWYSVDAETGVPAEVPPGVRLAYLQTAVTSTPPATHLVFRVHRLRRVPITRIGLGLVCTTETGLPGTKGVTCTSCCRCYR
jgi:hypothetical protein